MTDLGKELQALLEYDTPTVCNALESIDSSRRAFGFTDDNFLCLNVEYGPVCGIALTATMRSARPSVLDSDSLRTQRLEYYEYMHQDVGASKICIMQDIDGGQVGRGPFWGEFNVRIHRAMGFTGIVTDGSVRDRGKLPPDILILARGLRPSHAYVHVVDYGGQVTIAGMAVAPGDVVHADEHGAVVFSRELLVAINQHAELFVDGERPIMDACKAGTLSIEELRRLYLARQG